MNKSITLVTSIMPIDIENQKKAIQSWVKCGFKIISCNIWEEIEIIMRDFPDVEFVEIKRDSRSVNGKPCPYIFDMLQVLREKGDEVCGIVNSDIYLRHFSAGMYEYIYEIAKKDMLFTRRQDVEKVEDADTGKSELLFEGIDTFFFPRNFIEKIQDVGLVLGQAMWDYWFPIVTEKAGLKIWELLNPITYHVIHRIRWNDSLTEDICIKICEQIFPEVQRENTVDFLKNRFFKIISSPDGQLCYLPEHMQGKRVLVFGEYIDEENKRRLEKNENLRIDVKHASKGNMACYDYVIEIPYKTVFSKAFPEISIWLLETFHRNSIWIPVYWRGNTSNMIPVENAYVVLHRKFNREISPIKVYRSSKIESAVRETDICFICAASILTEENEKVRWEQSKLEGRVFLTPAGYAAQRWLKRYGDIAEELEVLGWLDNSDRLQGANVGGWPVLSPRRLPQIQGTYDKVVIVSNWYAEEIYKQLKEYVTEDKLVIWNEYDAGAWLSEQKYLV